MLQIESIRPVPGTADVESREKEGPREEALELAMTGLAGLIRERFSKYRNHRDSGSGSSAGDNSDSISNRINNALRQYNGRYSPSKLQDIKAFGGSEVFSRLTTVKCRGATAMLRDVFLGAERTWAVQPTPVPTLPEDVMSSVDQLVGMEVVGAAQAGQPVPPDQIQQRRAELFDAAERATYKRATEDAKRAERYIDDILFEGGFYRALTEFLADLPIFPAAAIKGPVVRMTVQLKWVDGQMTKIEKPKMFWNRVPPENLYTTPGASSIEESDIIEKVKVSRADLNALIGVPGYFEEAIREVLNDYDKGLVDWIANIDTDMADQQSKENPTLNVSELLDTLEFHGAVQGKHLLELGYTKKQVPDPDKDYHITAWLIGRHVIKAHINPNPKAHKPYYVTSFEQVPGSLYGHGIPEIINDVQDVANATLRSLVNNMSISSGPQVAINEDRLSPNTDADSLYPWKRWRFRADPFGNQAPPIDFFQPQSNAAELLAVYKEMQNIADETSAIPRYMTGSEKVGGAASTASGLSMLLNNASKVLQNVAAAIDNDIMQPALQDLYEMIMLTDKSGIFRGDESIVVRGVSIAMQRETDRARRLEFLQLTGNPVDLNIVGANGRAKILRSIAEDLGMRGEEIVPNEAELKKRMQEQQQAAQAEQAQQTGAHMAQTDRPKSSGQIMQPEAPV